ncbi:hypothetical protein CEXT_802651 [Caerostris extrusa]|uniref:Uncharacterized protein n=1 Tax=Caerostris extrusa TaxID=172846 RepID=A0AAV4NU70_CAEEX|nr:hypothetical protein CEXT_802651 [Caerostris extrusa]
MFENWNLWRNERTKPRLPPAKSTARPKQSPEVSHGRNVRAQQSDESFTTLSSPRDRFLLPSKLCLGAKRSTASFPSISARTPEPPL